ncbi:DUF2795 domain-containing protein [Fischerella sp. JS2]|uniref:DUF2795 domain-containing protein n=1 Tax=Fischerella sp. JS2 TaxID=2597771 RepID=UPI0028E1ABD1|nr:DUF2795 domain-containing protein [Fischerella sp. JS2]
MTTVNSVQLQKNLHETNYPISKKDLIKYAEEKGFDEKILRLLKQLPSIQYETPVDVSKAIANINNQ